MKAVARVRRMRPRVRRRNLNNCARLYRAQVHQARQDFDNGTVVSSTASSNGREPTSADTTLAGESKRTTKEPQLRLTPGGGSLVRSSLLGYPGRLPLKRR